MNWEQPSYIATTFGLPLLLLTLVATAYQISAASKSYCLQWIYRYLEERRGLEDKWSIAAKSGDEGDQHHCLTDFLNFLEATCMAYHLDLIPSRARPVIFRDLCHSFATLKTNEVIWNEVQRQLKIQDALDNIECFLQVNRTQIARYAQSASTS